MGNYMCMTGKGKQVQDEWQGPPVKVIYDGAIEVFRRPVKVAEIMKRYPAHHVCHSSAMISALTMKSALPGECELEGGRLYYVLPAHKFEEKKQAPATPERLVGAVPERNFTVKIKAAPGFAQVTVKGQATSKLFFDKHGGIAKDQVDDDQEPMISYSSPELRSMYLMAGSQPSLTRSKSWKPRLETINEVSAASRRHIQNYMRARSLRKSHNS